MQEEFGAQVRATAGAAKPAELAPVAPLLTPGNTEGAGKEITNSIGMKLVRIPAGKFMMGSPAGEEDRDEDEDRSTRWRSRSRSTWASTR